PLVALPGFERRILADRLAEFGRAGVKQDLIVGSFRISPPCPRSVLHVVGGDMGLNTELAAADADEHLVLDDERGARSGFALLRIAILDAPHLLASLRIKRHERRVGLMQENLGV